MKSGGREVKLKSIVRRELGYATQRRGSRLHIASLDYYDAMIKKQRILNLYLAAITCFFMRTGSFREGVCLPKMLFSLFACRFFQLPPWYRELTMSGSASENSQNTICSATSSTFPQECASFRVDPESAPSRSSATVSCTAYLCIATS